MGEEGIYIFAMAPIFPALGDHFSLYYSSVSTSQIRDYLPYINNLYDFKKIEGDSLEIDEGRKI